MGKIQVLCILLYIFILCGHAQNDLPVIQAYGEAIINTKIKSLPQAKLMARRSAKIIALRNLLAKVMQVVPVKKENKEMYIIEGIIAGYEYEKPTYTPQKVIVGVKLSVKTIFQNYFFLTKRMERLQEKHTLLESKYQKEVQDKENVVKKIQEFEKRIQFMKAAYDKEKQYMKNILAKKDLLIKENDRVLFEREKKLKGYVALLEKTQNNLIKQKKRIFQQAESIKKKSKKLKEKEDLINLSLIKLKTNQEKLALLTNELLKKEQELQEKKEVLEKKEYELSRSLEILKNRKKNTETHASIENKKLLALLGKYKIKDERNKKALQSLQTRYNEQQKALLAFEKQFKEMKHNLSTKQTFDRTKEYKIKVLEKKLEENWYIEKELKTKVLKLGKLLDKNHRLLKTLTKKLEFAKYSLEQKKQEILTLKSINTQQKDNLKKMIALLSKMNFELRSLWRKYQILNNNMMKKKLYDFQYKDKIDYLQNELQSNKDSIKYWKKQYFQIWEAYNTLVKQLARKSKGKINNSNDALLKDIYIGQEILIDKMNTIIKKLFKKNR